MITFLHRWEREKPLRKTFSKMHFLLIVGINCWMELQSAAVLLFSGSSANHPPRQGFSFMCLCTKNSIINICFLRSPHEFRPVSLRCRKTLITDSLKEIPTCITQSVFNLHQKHRGRGGSTMANALLQRNPSNNSHVLGNPS